jgi:hypothetical protein
MMQKCYMSLSKTKITYVISYKNQQQFSLFFAKPELLVFSADMVWSFVSDEYQ